MIKGIQTFSIYVKRKMSIQSFNSLSPKDRREIFLKWKYGLSVAACEALFITDKYIVNRVKQLMNDAKFVADINKDNSRGKFLRYMKTKIKFQSYSEEVLVNVEAGRVY